MQIQESSCLLSSQIFKRFAKTAKQYYSSHLTVVLASSYFLFKKVSPILTCSGCTIIFKLINILKIFQFLFFKRFYLLIFREREGKKKEERNINVWLPLMHPPTRDLAHNPGMCPHWELNRQPFSLQASAQPTEPHQPGPISNAVNAKSYITHITKALEYEKVLRQKVKNQGFTV